ncbi:MAG: UDP-N-acetylglucosamine 2-epimerase (non-hydrolyzing) [Deltaproteobacteria bacterium]|nr:UDP-N-acetylglucosamine 2-epimerase (non-hydrolyzing) [Deltaproteobacteria bacterium]
MSVALVIGVRPEVVKMAPVIRACRTLGFDSFVLHTGQHYDWALDGLFFAQLELEKPDVRLDVRGGAREEQLTRTRAAVREVLEAKRARAIVVQGDTNSTLGAAFGGLDAGIPVVHVEAGLRCGDLRMAEEHNRRECDAFAQLLCAPTELSRSNLLGEHVPGQIAVTGNTVVDELHRQLARLPAPDLSSFVVAPGEFLLATVHRRETVEDDAALRDVFRGLELAAEHAGMPVVAPLHPRTQQRLAEVGVALGKRVRAIPPAGYVEFMQLHRSAALVLTDSGGVQEEACVLGVPCVILRETTERPEAVHVGAARIAGVSADAILDATRALLGRRGHWQNPFGDGKAGERIAKLVAELIA